jgi:hypothetical protein
MGIESAYSQGLVPRLTQHLVRVRTSQSVVHPATDQGTDYTADETANRGGNGHCGLRGLVWVVSIWHVNPTPVFAIQRYFLTRKKHPAARAVGVCGRVQTASTAH